MRLYQDLFSQDCVERAIDGFLFCGNAQQLLRTIELSLIDLEMLVPDAHVLDTNVVVSGLRSRNGASFALLGHLERGDFEVALSVPLVLEYEDVLLREIAAPLKPRDVRDFVDAICSMAHRQAIFFLWRPMLSDPKDDMIAELAVAADCSAIVTHNVRDFEGVDAFGIDVLTPGKMLYRLRGER